MLHGEWQLLYSSDQRLNGLIRALNSIPLVDVGGLYQAVDARRGTVHSQMQARSQHSLRR